MLIAGSGWGIYLLTAIFAVSMGLNVAYADRWVQIMANVGVVACFVGVLFTLPEPIRWIVAPVFICLSTATTLVTMRARSKRRARAATPPEEEPEAS